MAGASGISAELRPACSPKRPECNRRAVNAYDVPLSRRDHDSPPWRACHAVTSAKAGRYAPSPKLWSVGDCLTVWLSHLPAEAGPLLSTSYWRISPELGRAATNAKTLVPVGDNDAARERFDTLRSLEQV